MGVSKITEASGTGSNELVLDTPVQLGRVLRSYRNIPVWFGRVWSSYRTCGSIGYQHQY